MQLPSKIYSRIIRCLLLSFPPEIISPFSFCPSPFNTVYPRTNHKTLLSVLVLSSVSLSSSGSQMSLLPKIYITVIFANKFHAVIMNINFDVGYGTFLTKFVISV